MLDTSSHDTAGWPGHKRWDGTETWKREVTQAGGEKSSAGGRAAWYAFFGGFVMEIDLRWVASLSCSGLHAADALRRGRTLARTPIASAISGPAERLAEEVRNAALPEERFWGHLVALSAEMGDPRRLVETSLQKAVGCRDGTGPLLSRLAGAVAGLEAAVRRTMPNLLEEVAAWAQPLVEAWDRFGPALLRAVAWLTEPGLLAPHAGIVAVYPALGGGGGAHLWYNTVRIEAMPSDPVPGLPEVVRLAWLVSELQTDLPVYSESILRDRLNVVAAAAMLPAVLAAAQEVSLIARGPLPIQRAVEAWRPTGSAIPETAEAIRAWWETYTETRPAWNVALGALNEMLSAELAAVL
jgi:hypothetical protein